MKACDEAFSCFSVPQLCHYVEPLASCLYAVTGIDGEFQRGKSYRA